MPFGLACLIGPAAMPARAADGTMTLVLCTGDGPVEMVVDLGGHAPAPAPDKAARPCDWAAAHVVGAVLPPASGPVAIALTRRAVQPAPHPGWHAGFRPDVPQARGPPASA